MRRISSLFHQRIVVGGLAAFFALAILFSRRSQTITTPQVWSEDGRYIIPQFINHGWLSLLEPVNGYLVFISRFISNTTLTLVPESYPLASTLLSWFFTAIVAAYIAIAPTLLKKRLLLAMSCFVVPVEPEVFGIPLYAFWWAGLVLLTIPLWQLSSRYFKFRLITLFVCGLSSPLVVLIAPLLALRAYYFRYRSDYLLFLLSIICSAIQLHYILLGNANTSMSQLSWSKIIKIIEKFFGYFITNTDVNFFGSFVYAGAFILALVSFSIFTSRDRWVNVVLGYYLLGTILLSITRVPIDSIHPVFSGQRYFFYPYVLIAWIFIQGMNFSSRFIHLKFLSFLLVTVLSLSIYNISRTGWSRENGDIEWSKNIESCTHFDEYKIPIHTDGHLANVWRENYSKEICKFLATKKKNPSESLYPFTVEDIEIYLSDKSRYNLESFKIATVANELRGSNFDRSAPVGHIPLGTLITGDEDRGSITLSMQKGARILYTSGPGGGAQYFELRSTSKLFYGRLPICVQWCSLVFSFDELPSEFVVKFSDNGTSWGEWFAIGMPIQ